MNPPREFWAGEGYGQRGEQMAVREACKDPELSQGGSEGSLAVGNCGSEDLEKTWGLEGGDRLVRRGQSSM